MVMLVIGGVEVYLGLPVEQINGSNSNTCAKLRKECNVIKNWVASHNQETDEIKKATKAVGLKFGTLTEVLDKVISDYKEISETLGGEPRGGEWKS
jgi:hypothetical protein